jgi:hypothetical protein
MKGIERLITERNRLVGTIGGVVIQPGDRVAFHYHDTERVAVVVGMTRRGFQAREDGTVKSFIADKITDFKKLITE